MVSSERESILQRITDGLDQVGIAFTHSHHKPVYTSAEAAEVRGASLHSGAKALILKAGDRFLMAVMPADLALNSVAIRKLIGCKKIRFANAEELLRLTGLTPGAVPPFGSMFDLETICDERLADNQHINFNAGCQTDSIQMSYNDYLTFESPRIATITKS